MDNHNSWIKLYRKTLDNGILKDHTAWATFSYFLMTVDYATGRRRLSRLQMSDDLGIKPNTLYKVIKRLEKKFGVIKLIGQNNYTDVCIVNWAKYQSSSTDDQIIVKSASTDNQKSVNDLASSLQKEKQEKESNKEKEIKEKKNKEILADKPQVSPREISPKAYERTPEDRRTKLQRVCYYLEDTLNTSIVNWGKQAKALKMLEQAGYTEEQIRYTIKQMNIFETWREGLGFDLMDVVDRIPKYKAQARKAVVVDV